MVFEVWEGRRCRAPESLRRRHDDATVRLEWITQYNSQPRSAFQVPVRANQKLIIGLQCYSIHPDPYLILYILNTFQRRATHIQSPDVVQLALYRHRRLPDPGPGRPLGTAIVRMLLTPFSQPKLLHSSH